MNEKTTNLGTQMQRSQNMAMETFQAQMLSAKQPLLLAYQRKEITAQEYEEQTGETVAETLAQQFALDRRRQLRQMYDKVDAGYITIQECEQITGVPYDPDALNPLLLMKQAKMAVHQCDPKAADPKDTSETESAPQDVTVDLSKKEG